jgi:hypothetical protein
MPQQRPYQDRSDLEKLQAEWTKLSGLRGRDEASAAVVRAATAAEIAANFAIRREFAARSTFSPQFVDGLLRWANGLSGKIDRLLMPLSENDDRRAILQALREHCNYVNAKRNAVVHQGEFCNDGEVDEVVRRSREFIETVVRLYEPDFRLKDKASRAARADSHGKGILQVVTPPGGGA